MVLIRLFVTPLTIASLKLQPLEFAYPLAKQVEIIVPVAQIKLPVILLKDVLIHKLVDNVCQLALTDKIAVYADSIMLSVLLTNIAFLQLLHLAFVKQIVATSLFKIVYVVQTNYYALLIKRAH